MSRLGIVLAAVVLLAGCATVDDLRRQEPRRTAIAGSDFRTLARCVADGLREARPQKEWPYPTFLLTELPVQDHITEHAAWKLFFMLPVGTPIPTMDLRFAPDEKGVLVEARGSADSDLAWPLVDECAKVNPVGPVR